MDGYWKNSMSKCLMKVQKSVDIKTKDGVERVEKQAGWMDGTCESSCDYMVRFDFIITSSASRFRVNRHHNGVS